MKQKTILVVDDEPNFLVHLHLLLGDHYRVHGVTSARGGLEQVRTLSPDLILLDLKMPGMGGIDFLRELKSGNSHIPTIIMSAYGDIASAAYPKQSPDPMYSTCRRGRTAATAVMR